MDEVMKQLDRSELEFFADGIERIARNQPGWAQHEEDVTTKRLFSIAWEIKQLARAGTASEGV